jgi:hypothetical protein
MALGKTASLYARNKRIRLPIFTQLFTQQRKSAGIGAVSALGSTREESGF